MIKALAEQFIEYEQVTKAVEFVQMLREDC